MSKHNRNNYNKMYEQKNDESKTVDTAAEYKVEEIKDVTAEEPVEVSLEDSVEEEIAVEIPSIVGKVVNCTKLAVRKSPVPGAEMIATLNVSATVMIDVEKSTSNYFKVCTEAGVEGFCSKDYIAVN